MDGSSPFISTTTGVYAHPDEKETALSVSFFVLFVKDNHSLSEWIKSLQLWTKINSCNTIEATDNRNKSKTGGLMKDIDSLAHTKWRCQYHIVFAPKYRRQIIYGKYKAAIGKILRRICERCEGVEIIEANACEDHIHMLVTIPPKLSVSRFMGILKGKSSLMIFDQFANLKYKYGNRHFWCRGYYVDTVTYFYGQFLQCFNNIEDSLTNNKY